MNKDFAKLFRTKYGQFLLILYEDEEGEARVKADAWVEDTLCTLEMDSEGLTEEDLRVFFNNFGQHDADLMVTVHASEFDYDPEEVRH